MTPKERAEFLLRHDNHFLSDDKTGLARHSPAVLDELRKAPAMG